MDLLFIYLIIGLFVAVTLALREGAGWRETVFQLVVVSLGWLPILCWLWFCFVVFSGALSEESEKEVKS